MQYFKQIAHIDSLIAKGNIEANKKELFSIIKSIEYANYFFDKVNSIDWLDALKIEGHFSPSNAPKPIPSEPKGSFSIPEWNVLRYLERVSGQLKGLTPDDQKKYTDELLNIIRGVTKYHIDNNGVLDNYRTWWLFTKILANIPDTNLIKDDIIDLIPHWLESEFDNSMVGAEIGRKLLPKFLTTKLDDIKKAEKIINYITALTPIPWPEESRKLFNIKKDTRLKLIVDDYWIREALEVNAKMIGETCTDEVVWDLVANIRKIFKDENNPPLTISGAEKKPIYSTGAWESFYEERDHVASEPIEILTFGLKQILLAKAKAKPPETEQILENFLKDNYLYFPKMALYVIGQDEQNISNYEGLFWEWLKAVHKNLGLHSSYWGDELKHLLQKIKTISPEHSVILKDKIEDMPEYLYLNRGERSEYYKALHKQEIYQALKHIPEFNVLYEEMKKITTIDVELSPAIGTIVSWDEPGPSSISVDNLLTRSNQELAKHFREFRTKNRFEESTVHGLAEMLKQAVETKPEKFIDDLDPFINTFNIYIYEIIWGAKDAWNKKKIFDWGKLLEFIRKYIDNEHKDFWDNKLKIDGEDSFWNANHEWVLGAIAELIQDGVRRDEWAFDEKRNELAKEILFLIIGKLTPEAEGDIKEPVTHALNSVWGKILTAHILLALRIARLADIKAKEEDQKWGKDFKDKYEKALNDKVNEAYTLFGRYMPNLSYLDKGWVEGKIKEWENITDEALWNAFMTGYLWSGGVYNNLYPLMNKHYKKALDRRFEEHHSKEILVEHIGVGYLRKLEELTGDRLLTALLDKWNHEQINDLIGFFWMQRTYLVGDKEKKIEVKDPPQNKEIKQRILDFWGWLYNKLKDETTLSKENKEILSRVGELAIFLPEIDATNFNWLMLSARGMSQGHGSTFFIEYLNDLKNKGDRVKTVRYIGKIFLEMLKDFTPDYDKKHIRAIVDFIFETKDAEAMGLADEICDIYGRRGYEKLLRDIWEKYNKDN